MIHYEFAVPGLRRTSGPGRSSNFTSPSCLGTSEAATCSSKDFCSSAGAILSAFDVNTRITPSLNNNHKFYLIQSHFSTVFPIMLLALILKRYIYKISNLSPNQSCKSCKLEKLLHLLYIHTYIYIYREKHPSRI